MLAFHVAAFVVGSFKAAQGNNYDGLFFMQVELCFLFCCILSFLFYRPTIREIKLSTNTGRLLLSTESTPLRPVTTHDWHLADVRFFRPLSILQQVRGVRKITHGVETVFLRSPKHLTFFSDQDQCRHVSNSINPALAHWRDNQTDLALPERLISLLTPHQGACIPVTSETILVHEPPPESDFLFLHKSTGRFSV